MKLTPDRIAKNEQLAKMDLDKAKQGRPGGEPGSLANTAAAEEKVTKAIREKPISIKLPPHLIDDLKEIAGMDNIGYQTYIKQVLSRHVRELRKEQAKEMSKDDSPPRSLPPQ